MDDVYCHPTAIVESTSIGPRTKIWAGVHVMATATIGADCNICDAAFIDDGVQIGDAVTIKNFVHVSDGAVLERGVFLGPGAVLTNDRSPRSKRAGFSGARYDTDNWLQGVHLEVGASIGANAVVGPGVTVGRFAMVGAGAVVTRDVEPHALVVGVPARPAGWVCSCGVGLIVPGRDLEVACACGVTATWHNEGPKFSGVEA